MHEVEFLPEWYPAMRRRKFAVVIQAAASLTIVLGLVVTVFIRELDIHRQQQSFARNVQQISRTNQRLAKLDEVLAFQRQLRRQVDVIGQLGVDVDATRVMNALESAMPAKMALTGLSVETQEQTPPVVSPVSTASADRWLTVRMQGVAPTDVEVAILLDNLSKMKFLENVTMSYIRDRTEAGHAMRDFELCFKVKLNAAGGGRS